MMHSAISEMTVQNHRPFPIKDIPRLSLEEFLQSVSHRLSAGSRMIGLFALNYSPPFDVIAVLADPLTSFIHIIGTEFYSGTLSYPSFASTFPQTHYFECELAEDTGIYPENHPWFRPVRKDAQSQKEFYRMRGDEIHEVAVGPIHAGVIEPGHFRFQCHGEKVYHLEIRLGYQHRGIEQMMTTANDLQRLILAESIAGDTVIGHSLAYAMAIEGLTETSISLRAQTIRSVAEELERAAMHLAGLSGIANDIGLAIAAGAYGRLRTLIINSSGALCGSRFGRGLVTPGGVRYDVNAEKLSAMTTQIQTVQQDVEQIHEFMFNLTGALSRFENTGTVSHEMAESIGMVGPAARASGIPADTRHQFPYGAYRYGTIPLILLHSGDVYARARIRALELKESLRFIMDHIANLPSGNIHNPPSLLPPDQGIISLTEGWRGEIMHAIFTDPKGNISRYKIKDPSFHNWYGLSLALRQQDISDFPLCNKSFDLSYAGHDL